MRNNIVSILCGMVLMFGTISSAFAEEIPKENSFRYNDGVPIISESDSDISLTAVNGEGLKGIDVSTHQGAIDWERVKADGIDFAVIRCGFGDDYESYDDAQWKRNADECTRLGIPFGAYLYSYAASIGEAESEASHAIRLLEGYDLSLPVYLDLEDEVVADCSNELIGQMADIFCTALQNEGYDVGIYANLNWWNTRLTSDVFSNTTWHKWIAQWSSACTYGGDYTMWQYTSSGSVDGISGRVDMDMWYGDNFNLNIDNDIAGDINGDGKADAGDAGMILRHDAGIIALTQEQQQKCDMNGDGIINAADAGIILRKDAGIL